MRFNHCGEYNPVMEGDCVSCGICEKVCPFLNGNANEDTIASECFSGIEGIKHRPETGYYLNSYAGYASDPEMRWDGASGGMLTQTLCKLLKLDIVDYVITVSPNPDPEKLFHFVVVSTPDDVKRCAKSAYYPVEISEALRNVLQNKGRYAVVGLPCVCKAIRLAQKKSRKLRDRIHVILGLVCGKQQSKYYSQRVSLMAGMTEPPVSVCFRNKREGIPATNIIFSAFSNNDTKSEIQGADGVSKLWADGVYTLKSCYYCDDVFAECADASFMDAWLPEYFSDSKGTSLVITRNSQSGALFAKRQGLAAILLLPRLLSRRTPEKRAFRNGRIRWSRKVILHVNQYVISRLVHAFMHKGSLTLTGKIALCFAGAPFFAFKFLLTLPGKIKGKLNAIIKR
jgi:coenzyme F420-reducing hydrogenase beta subunit